MPAHGAGVHRGGTVNADRPQLSDPQAPGCAPQRHLAGTDGGNPVG